MSTTNGPTPGPWRAGYASERERREQMIVRAEDVDGQPYVALVPNRGDDRHEADARLVAASPDLLAACKAAIATIARLTPMGDERHEVHPALARAADRADVVRDILRAAIDRAEGREPEATQS